MDALRIVFYSHDSLGLGHTRRNLAIAHSLASELQVTLGRPVSGLLISGEPTATTYPAPDGWDWFVLPGISKRDDRYCPRNLGVSMTDLIGLRSAMLRAAIIGFRPDLFIVDRHAFGVDNELRSTLEELRLDNPQCRTVLGLREVLDSPDSARDEWDRLGDAAEVARLFDRIWVYGDPAVHDALRTGEIPPALAGMVDFSGYLSVGRQVSAATPSSLPPGEPFVLSMVGGGSDGFRLASLAARAPLPSGLRHLVITGPQMPAEHRARILEQAAPGVRVVTHVPDALAEVQRARAVVSMGGYNSVCEVMSTTVPALIVPRQTHREEQLIRARSLTAAGAIEYRTVDRLTSEGLGEWFANAVSRRVLRTAIDLDGLTKVARLAHGLMAGRPMAPTALVESSLSRGASDVEYHRVAV